VYAFSGKFIMEGGEISYNTASGEGGGVRSGSNTFALHNGRIFGNKAANGGGIYSANNITIEGGEITGNTATDNGGGIYHSGTYQINISNAVISANSAPNGDGGGIWINYTRLSNLKAYEDVVFENNSASQAYLINTADIPTHDANILTHSFTIPFTYGYNNFDISYTVGIPINTILNIGTLETTGATPPDGLFQFGLFQDDVLQAIGISDSQGGIEFINVFATVGLYDLTMRQLTPEEMTTGALLPDGRGWVLDETEFPVTVTVNPSFVINDITFPDGEPHFINSFESNDCGLIQFPDLMLNEPGTFVYTIKEGANEAGNNWTPDGREYRVIVTVEDDGEGNLVVTSLSYPDGLPEFINSFEYTPTCIIISANKVAIGAPLVCDMFTFNLYDSEGNVVATTTNRQPGTIPPTPCTSW